MPNSWHYTNQPSDAESGLTHALYRQLSTTQGRWLTPDPAGLAAVVPSTPQTWNRYAYVANNPLSSTDPLGLYLSYPGSGCEAAAGDPCGGSDLVNGSVYFALGFIDFNPEYGTWGTWGVWIDFSMWGGQQQPGSWPIGGGGGCNFNVAITNTNNLTDAEAKSAWAELERLFGLAGLGAILTTPQSADFTINLAQYPTTFWGSLTAPPAPAGSNGGFDWYGTNDSSTIPTNSATVWQNNVEMAAAGMNMGVALGRGMFHEFAHWGLGIGPHGSNPGLETGIMAPGALGTFLNGYATLSPQQIELLRQKCQQKHGGIGP